MPSIQEVSKHDNKKDCWVIIHGKAYDVTEFLPSHPGGQKIILRYAGKDCTKKFDPVHPPDTLEKYLSKDKHLGDVTGLDNNKQEEKQLVTDPVELKRLELVARKTSITSNLRQECLGYKTKRKSHPRFCFLFLCLFAIVSWSFLCVHV